MNDLFDGVFGSEICGANFGKTIAFFSLCIFINRNDNYYYKKYFVEYLEANYIETIAFFSLSIFIKPNVNWYYKKYIL